ncbi:MAG: tRNA1(Val) (adenine(37)-N6)-methyltransferase [Clostridiales bacterium]|nr:tRNA1(Val) (adenine(37)-N6)-methyltransferase [Clostridiales bacterium]
MPSFDELWPTGPRFKQSENSFKLSTDSVLLADFVNMRRAGNCLDLGSGCGVLCILLAFKNLQSQILGIELQKDYADLSLENLRENALDGRVSVINADLRSHRSLFPAESFDLVVSNPPYFPLGSGYMAPSPHRAAARGEENCSLSELVSCAKWALRYGGSFALVHRPERLSEIFCAMSSSGIEPKRLRLVSYSAHKAPALALIEGKRGGKAGLKIEAPLIMTDEHGGESDEVQKIYRRGKYRPNTHNNQDSGRTGGWKI